jgi:hypothetical protein
MKPKLSTHLKLYFYAFYVPSLRIQLFSLRRDNIFGCSLLGLQKETDKKFIFNMDIGWHGTVACRAVTM